MNTNIFTLSLADIVSYYNNSTNKWYWTQNTSPLKYNIQLNIKPFILSSGDNKYYRKNNTKKSIRFNFENTPPQYTRLPLQFSKWVDCCNQNINTISCEGINALNQSLSGECTFNIKKVLK